MATWIQLYQEAYIGPGPVDRELQREREKYRFQGLYVTPILGVDGVRPVRLRQPGREALVAEARAFAGSIAPLGKRPVAFSLLQGPDLLNAREGVLIGL